MNLNAEVIKQNISMHDILNRYGLKLNRRGAMCCPFHREKTPSFKVYQNGKKFHCFGCGIDGDIITFAMKYYCITYGQAITRLASEFGVPITGAKTLTIKERIQMQEARKKHKQADELLETEYNRLFDAYLLACDEYTRLSNNLTAYAPKSLEESLDERYCEAVKMLPVKNYECEMAQAALKEFEERRYGGYERDNSGPTVHKRGLPERTRAV